jgi:tyrosyl-tRNA synthetase
MNAFEDLKWRGSVYDSTAGAKKLLADEKVTAYCGFDPTSDTLHAGHLIPIMGLRRLQEQGHSPIALVGGGTGMIGDPREKEERPLLPRAEIEANAEAMRAQLGRFLDFDTKANPARMVNNADWLLKTTAIDFMRDVGKHFSVNRMLTRDSVRNRLAREDGISYTEFSYMLLQAYDYLSLHEQYGCKLQIGGSDQWGNLLAGVDLIRRVKGAEVQALVYPLLTTASGEKFGKSIAGAPALDAEQTSPYRLYQFFFNSEDKDVISYLKFFTLLDQEDIAGLEQAVADDPRRREAQRTLAREVIRMVHGQDGLAAAERGTAFHFGDAELQINASELTDVFADVPSHEFSRDDFIGEGLPVTQALSDSGMTRSLGEARRLIEQGGIYFNNHRVSDASMRITLDDVIGGEVFVLRRGTRNHLLGRIRTGE